MYAQCYPRLDLTFRYTVILRHNRYGGKRPAFKKASQPSDFAYLIIVRHLNLNDVLFQSQLMVALPCKEITDKLNQEDQCQNEDQGNNDHVVLVTLVADRDGQVPETATSDSTGHGR